MAKIEFDREKCVKCRACVKDCITYSIDFDEEGYPYLDMFSEEFVNFYEKLFAFDYKTNDIWTNTQA